LGQSSGWNNRALGYAVRFSKAIRKVILAAAPSQPACEVAPHAASNSRSRADDKPAFSFACRSGGCCLNQSRVSVAVIARGRKVSPAATALRMLRSANPALLTLPGAHTGLSLHWATFRASRYSLCHLVHR